MPNPDPVRRYRPLLYAAAVLLTGLTVLYAGAWMYYIRQPMPEVEIGIDEKHTPNGTLISAVHPGSPAEAAGLKANDFITAIDGNRADSPVGWSSLMFHTWLKAKPGDKVVLSIQRPGQAQPLTMMPIFRAAEGAGDTKGTVAYTVGREIIDSYPVFFAVVGFTVLFLRIEDRNAWLLALVFTTWITGGPMPSAFSAAPNAAAESLLAYRTVTSSLLTGLFYFFFAVFPKRSPIDLKAPWLKWTLLACNICLGYGGFSRGESRPLPLLTAFLPSRALQVADDITGYAALLLGILSLVLNIWRSPEVTDRRKLKVILWGTVVGVTPMVVLYAFIDFTQFRSPFWLSFVCVVLMILFPLSFSYAVVKHRVMDIPVLLKRSARYFVVERGFVILIMVLSVGLTLWFGQAFSRYFSAGSKAAIPIGATFGVLVISGATQVHRRVRTRLDRAFFRSSYDAQQILADLAARTLTVTTRDDLASLLQQKIWGSAASQLDVCVSGKRRWSVLRVCRQRSGGGDDAFAKS
jgi:PDZ domain